MDSSNAPTQTVSGRQSLRRSSSNVDRIFQALLSTVDGHRSVVELESVARAMGLQPTALEVLRQRGLIELPAAI